MFIESNTKIDKLLSEWIFTKSLSTSKTFQQNMAIPQSILSPLPLTGSIHQLKLTNTDRDWLVSVVGICRYGLVDACSTQSTYGDADCIKRDRDWLAWVCSPFYKLDRGAAQIFSIVKIEKIILLFMLTVLPLIDPNSQFITPQGCTLWNDKLLCLKYLQKV